MSVHTELILFLLTTFLPSWLSEYTVYLPAAGFTRVPVGPLNSIWFPDRLDPLAIYRIFPCPICSGLFPCAIPTGSLPVISPAERPSELV